MRLHLLHKHSRKKLPRHCLLPASRRVLHQGQFYGHLPGPIFMPPAWNKSDYLRSGCYSRKHVTSASSLQSWKMPCDMVDWLRWLVKCVVSI